MARKPKRKPAKDGYYHVSVRYTDPATGAAKRFHSSARTAQEADALEQRFLAWLEGPVDPRVERQTMREFVNDFLEVKWAEVTPGSYYAYRAQLRTHVLPTLGNVRVGDVTPLMLDSLFRKMDVAPSYRHRIFWTLYAVFKRAVTFGQLARNPCAQLTDKISRGQAQRGDWLRPAQVPAYLAACEEEDSDYGDFLALLPLTGLRKSEGMGLRWKDDKGDHFLISQTRVRVRGQGLVVRPLTKTDESASSVPINATAREILNRVKARRKVRSISGADELIFPDIVETTVNRRLETILKRAGLPQIRVHDLRHSTASLLIAGGASMQVVQRVLRHTQIGTTADIYAHLETAAKRDAAALLDEFAGTSGSRKAQMEADRDAI